MALVWSNRAPGTTLLVFTVVHFPGMLVKTLLLVFLGMKVQPCHLQWANSKEINHLT